MHKYLVLNDCAYLLLYNHDKNCNPIFHPHASLRIGRKLVTLIVPKGYSAFFKCALCVMRVD